MSIDNEIVSRRIADRGMVGAMIYNLVCIDYDEAKEILDALAIRAAETDERPEYVSPGVVRAALKMLPPLPETKPASREYRYRAGPNCMPAIRLLDEQDHLATPWTTRADGHT